MKFFVTGATGFIGTHLCHHLTDQGHEVIALVRNKHKTKRLPQHNIQILEGNLESLKDPKFIIPQCDQVIHLAGTVTAKNTQTYYKDNDKAVQDLLDCVNRQNWKPTKLIFSSSQAAIGPSPIDKGMTEADAPSPVDDYGKAKHKAEQRLLDQKKFPVVIVRLPSVIGPLDTNVLNLFKLAKWHLGFVLKGVDQPISFIAVSDVITALDLLIHNTKDNNIYHVAHDLIMTPRQLWQETARAINKKIWIISIPKCILYLIMKLNTFFANVFGFKSVFDKKYYEQLKAPAWILANEKIKKIGWVAKKDLSKALKETAKSYLDEGWI